MDRPERPTPVKYSLFLHELEFLMPTSMMKNSFGNDRYVMQKGRRIKKKKKVLDVE